MLTQQSASRKDRTTGQSAELQQPMTLTWKKNDCRGYDAFADGRLCYTVENRKYGWYLVRVRADGSTAGVEAVRSMKHGKAYAETLYALTPNERAA